MSRRYRPHMLLLIGILVMAGFTIQSHAAFSPVIAINSNAGVDADTDSGPAIAAGANGTCVAVWVAPSLNPLDPNASDPGSANSYNDDLYFSRSTDSGKTWSARTLLKTNAPFDQYDDFEPSVATDGKGHWMVVWRTRDPLNNTIGFDEDIVMSYSSDDGLSWSAPSPVNNDATSDPGGSSSSTNKAVDWSPTVCTNGNGIWMVGWTRADNRTGYWLSSAMIATSSDGGAHWSNPAALQTRNEYGMYSLVRTTVTTDRLGHWIAAWITRTSSYSDFDVYYSTSTNNGANWSSPAMLNTNGATDSGDDDGIQITTDGLGHWIAVWHSTDSLGGTLGTDNDILYATSSNNGQTWSAPAPVNADAATDQVTNASTANDVWPVLAYDGAGKWLVAWATTKLGGDADFYYSTCGVESNQWTPMAPLNPWAQNDGAASDTTMRLASTGPGRWLAAWSSNYNPSTGGTADPDIFCTQWDSASTVTTRLADPRAINTDAATDSRADILVSIARGTGKTCIAVWSAPGPNPLDPAGNDPDSNNALNDDIFLARSSDGGRTWSPPALLKTNALTDRADDINPAIATDGRGHWLVVWQSKDPIDDYLGYDSDILMSYSANNGSTWSPPFAVNYDAIWDPGLKLNAPSGIIDQSPSVCCDGQGRWMVGWRRQNPNSGESSAMISVSTDNALNWSSPLALMTGSTGAIGGITMPLQLATDRQGRWLCAWMAHPWLSSGYAPFCASTTNNGLSWSAPVQLNTNGASSLVAYPPSLATDGQGRWIVAWDAYGGSLGSDEDILYASSFDGGQTWGTPAPLNSDAATDPTTSSGGKDENPRLIYDGAGTWVAAWTTDKLGRDPDCLYATLRQGDSAWSAPQPLNPWASTDNAAAAPDSNTVLSTDRQGRWTAAWMSAYDPLTGTVRDFDLYSRTWDADTPPSFLSDPLQVNSDASFDSDIETGPAVACSGQTWIAAWNGTNPNTPDPRGSDGGSGNSTNDDIYFARSLDNGKSWSAMAPIKTTAGTDYYDDLEADVTSDGKGRWMVVWRSMDPLGGTIGFDLDILFAFSADNGATWTAPAPVNTDAANDPGGWTSTSATAADTSPKVRSDGQGRWMVSWARFDNRSGRWQCSAMAASSGDNGAHWSTPATLQLRDDGGNYSVTVPDLATDRKGRWIACWSSRANAYSDFDIYYRISTNNGASWSAPATLNTNAASDSGTDAYPVIAADEQGRWMALWQTNDTLGGLAKGTSVVVYARSLDGGQTWSAPAPVNSDYGTIGNSASLPRLIHDGAGSWIAGWTASKAGGDQDQYWSAFREGAAGGWAIMQPINPWAETDSAGDGWSVWALHLASNRAGSWMAVWNSNYDPASGTVKDWDILSTMYNRPKNAADRHWLQVR